MFALLTLVAIAALVGIRFLWVPGTGTLNGAIASADSVDVLVYPDSEWNRFGLIRKDGTIVIEPVFEDYPHFSEGLAAVRDGIAGGYGYIDTLGQWKIPPRLRVFGNVANPLDDVKFSDGRALFMGENEKYGFIDRSGEVVIQPRFLWPAKFSEGLAYVVEEQPNGTVFDGYIDTDGTVAFNMPPGAFKLPVYDDDGYSEGLVTFRRETNRMGYLDRTGRVVVQAKFDDTRSFHEGLAAVSLDGRWGFINKSGEFVIEPTFAFADDFSEGLAAVETQDQGWGYINKSGGFEIEPAFAEAHRFREGLAIIKTDQNSSGSGFINPRGMMIVAPVCLVANFVENGVGSCWPFGYFDTAGTMVVPAPGYEGIHKDALKPSFRESHKDSRSADKS